MFLAYRRSAAFFSMSDKSLFLLNAFRCSTFSIHSMHQCAVYIIFVLVLFDGRYSVFRVVSNYATGGLIDVYKLTKSVQQHI